MSKPSKPGVGKTHPNGEDASRREVSGGLFVRGEIQTHLSPSELKKHESKEEAQQTRDNVRLLIEKLTLITVIIYGGITGIQAYETKKAIEVTKQQFALEHRAWIGEKEQHLLPLAVGKPLRAEIILNNFGNSPAFNVRTPRGWILAYTGYLDISKWIAAGEYRTKSGVVPVIWPNNVDILPFQTVDNMDQSQIDNIRSGARGVYLFGDILYDDVAGRDHLTRYCGHYVASSDRFEVCDYADAN